MNLVMPISPEGNVAANEVLRASDERNYSKALLFITETPTKEQAPLVMGIVQICEKVVLAIKHLQSSIIINNY